MEDIQQIHNLLMDATYCVCAYTPNLYLSFFKDLIQKYLSHYNNYHVYVSTTDKFSPLYQSMWPSHNRLIYISDNFIPTTIPDNINSIYFYHHTNKPTKDQQLNLINFVESHPNMKYVYVGNVSSLLTYTRTKLFKYYLHFQKSATRWSSIRTGGIVNYNVSRSVSRQYYGQVERKKKATGFVTFYDYYILHDNVMETSKALKFNKHIVKGKKKKVVPKTTNNNNNNTTTGNTTNAEIQNPKSEPIVKYVFTGVRTGGNCLIMPDGSKENYKAVVSKYQDIIEV
ncbi:putative ORFan [Tupanvirus deep ocean]|uniref:ORFan n=2 Tax=Tupanvirus TaxID=2094720 RepID=A0AC62A868_9VIRU|nr:putative ORFan [Tupanvirus deep ocean]QKU33852.1 putative ORFan [Tupanvirus deep ocean]